MSSSGRRTVASRGGNYSVVLPNELFGGKSYSDYLAEFWNWLYSIDCDQTNTADVVFLRGVSFGTSPDQGYVGGPVANVGTNTLNISKRQAVFFCNITTNIEAIDEREEYSEAQLRAQCIIDLNQSTIPDVQQILINGEPIRLPPNVSDCSEFRTITREFILNVPDSAYGRTIAPFLDVQLSPSEYRCVASGYCFLVRFVPGRHVLYSVGRGKPWIKGDYISELLYEINVTDTEIDRNRTLIPDRPTPKLPLSDNIYLKLQQLLDNKDIDKEKLDHLKKMINLRDKVKL
jgi:hypothetical protein